MKLLRAIAAQGDALCTAHCGTSPGYLRLIAPGFSADALGLAPPSESRVLAKDETRALDHVNALTVPCADKMTPFSLACHETAGAALVALFGG